jgi:hypothetical protein
VSRGWLRAAPTLSSSVSGPRPAHRRRGTAPTYAPASNHAIALNDPQASRRLGFIVVTLAALVVFGSCFARLGRIWGAPWFADYSAHLYWARELGTRFRPNLPHFLYHLSVVGAYNLVPGLSFQAAGYVLIPTLASVGLACLAFHVVTRSLGHLPRRRSVVAAAAVALALCLVGPFSLWSWPNLYFGYLAPTVFHNPTYTVMQPLALLLAWLVLQTLRDNRNDGRRSAGLAATTILSALAKPSYLLALIPALLVQQSWRAISGRERAAPALILWVVLPAVLVLAAQFLFTFGGGDSRIVVAPLAAMHALSGQLLAKLVSSVLFPLVVLLLYGRAALEDENLRFAWIVSMFGMGCVYFLAETGSRAGHGNFLWTGYVCNSILIILSAGFLLRQRSARAALLCEPGRIDWRWAAAAAVFCLHFASGLAYYVGALSADTFPSFHRLW